MTAYLTFPWRATSLLGFFLSTSAMVLGPPLAILLVIIGFLSYKSIGRMLALHVFKTDPYVHLPRPKHSDRLFPIFGDLYTVFKSPPTVPLLRWAKEVNSSVYVYRGLFYSPRLLLADSRAMLHVLSAANSYSYPKPQGTRRALKSILGEGVLVAEGDTHKKQRKLLQPAFSISAIRDLYPIFSHHSEALAIKIGDMIDRSSNASSKMKDQSKADGVNKPFRHQNELCLEKSVSGKPVIDVSPWLTKATLDIIGDAGFAHHFKSLEVSIDPPVEGIDEGEGDVLGNAFDSLVAGSLQMTLSRFLQIYLSSLPYLGWIRSIPTERQKIITQAYKKLEMVSLNLINRKKAEIQKEMQGLSKADFDEKEGHYDATGVARGKDLLHLMMRANMAEDVSEKEKLSDNELLGQITTLLLAGHETTSTQTTWTLHLLAEHPEIQRKLREEIHEHFGKGMERQIGYDEISSMKYLDCVVKEAMRFSSPVPTTIRVSSEDDVIPLSRSYHCHNDPSKTFDRIPISKGQEILIPIQAFNLSTDIWGPTAQQFDPTRWFEESLPSNARNSGLPLHLLTFIAGPRGCIGNRFAIAEFKALLVGLVGRFNFESVQGWEVEPKQTIVVRPRIVGQEHVGPQMPLRISRI